MLNNLLNRDLSAPAFLYVLFKKICQDAYPRILLYSLQGDVEEGGPVPGLFQSNLSGSVSYYLMILSQYFHYYLTEVQNGQEKYCQNRTL